MKIYLAILLLILGLFVSWFYLPERFLELIGNSMRLQFIIDISLNDMSPKWKVAGTFVFGFILIHSVSYKLFRDNYLYYLTSFVTVFISIFLGILICASIFKDQSNQVSIRDSLHMWIMLPMVVIMQILLKYLFLVIGKHGKRSINVDSNSTGLR